MSKLYSGLSFSLAAGLVSGLATGPSVGGTPDAGSEPPPAGTKDRVTQSGQFRVTQTHTRRVIQGT